MATTLADPLLGHLIDGRYEVLSRIARGGMATVYLAVDRRLDREVAIKVMHAHLAEGGTGAEFVARFRREARAAARLTHPGLVAVFDQGVDGETSYLTMEYVEGTNLRRRISDGPLSVRDAFDVLEAVLDALAAAHRVGLVHRDIKPENVLLAADGRVKVADFGLARAVTEVTATTTGTVLGTVAYLAPELVARGASDTRTDIYAAGILLYEMLTGAQPFTGATPIQIAYQHVNSDVPAPSAAVAWIPAELDELVEALAAREPDERPTDARAALDLVRRTRAALDDATLDRTAAATTTPAGTVEADAPASAGDADGATTPDPHATEALDVAARRADGVARADAPGDGAPFGRTMALRIGAGVDGPDGTDDPPPADGRRRRLGLLATVLLVLGLAAGGVWWYAAAGPGAYTTVPGGLEGVPLTQAQSVLAAAELEASVTEAFDPQVPDDVVVSATPAEGDRVRKDGTVELVVSKGPDLRVVPEGLAGLAVADATAALESAGFVVPEPVREYHDEVPLDHVIAVGAEPLTQLPVGSEVTLTVSDGREPVTVISVLGATREVAIQQLADTGLNVAEAADFSTEYPAGTVMAQSLAPDSQAFRLDVITITVSQGPPLVEVPNVFGQQFSAAKATLEGLGFVVAKENVLGGLFGTVHSQDVAAGTMAPVGSTITLRVV
ncbi:Stk1 family PASTA domain-containing Ser/Thr kinase [Actinotalea solisilvae]|uniref:Stk1 family PASTA domain-containing Ser/Thr kinase n=1 Tax=Actinotalea solisilvae TaxID=2072922 RepID=UPI0018F1A402|nr:Stk1 family PASTA domain-containing Ser/Thr kinase [Actinotalea solisilvae]